MFPKSHFITSFCFYSPASPELHSFGTDEYETESLEKNGDSDDTVSTQGEHSREHSSLLLQVKILFGFIYWVTQKGCDFKDDLNLLKSGEFDCMIGS